MRTPRLLLTGFFFLFVIATHADNKLKWGKLRPEDKAITECAYAPDFPAVILADVGDVLFSGGSNVKISHHKRINCLSKLASITATLLFPYIPIRVLRY